MAERVSIVFGGSGGIGRTVAERLAADGHRVLVSYSGNDQRAAEVVSAIEERGGAAIMARADVAEPDEVDAVFQAADSTFGGVDVVVNTAGVMLLGSVAEHSLDDFDRMNRINTRGTFVVAQRAARAVRDGGAIINFSSSVVKLALPTYAAYAGTKGAVDAMTMILAKELRGRDITVNAVAPGPTATPLFLDGKPQAAIDQLASMPPLERLGTPDDIAGVVAFLAGPARWINGQVLYVNGGIAG